MERERKGRYSSKRKTEWKRDNRRKGEVIEWEIKNIYIYIQLYSPLYENEKTEWDKRYRKTGRDKWKEESEWES